MPLKTISPVLLACLLLAGCYAPGEGRDADVGRARGAQLVRSIEAFRDENSRYPKTLEELVPTRLSRQDLALLLAGPPFFNYGRTAPQRYDLSFTYSGRPGTISCWYFSEQVELAWACHGAL